MPVLYFTGLFNASLCMQYSLNVLQRLSKVYSPECIQTISFISQKHAKLFHFIFPIAFSLTKHVQMACMKRTFHQHSHTI